MDRRYTICTVQCSVEKTPPWKKLPFGFCFSGDERADRNAEINKYYGFFTSELPSEEAVNSAEFQRIPKIGVSWNSGEFTSVQCPGFRISPLHYSIVHSTWKWTEKWTWMCTRTCTCLCSCTYECNITCSTVNVHIIVRVHVHVCVHVYFHIHVHVLVKTCSRTPTYVNLHVHVHVHVHIYL
jgi:hypothetical protein